MFHEELITLSYNKYKMLLAENTDLKNKMNIIDNTISNEFLQNVNHIISIDSLELKIVELESKIIYLENQNKILLHEVELLKDENRIIKEEIKILKEENRTIKDSNKSLNEQLKYLTDRDIVDKTIKVLQDLNFEYKLETNIKNKNGKLNRLRNERNSVCHYLLDDDCDILKYKKIEIILQHISSLDDTIKTHIESRFGKDILGNIVTYIQPLLEENLKEIIEEDGEDYDGELSYFWKY